MYIYIERESDITTIYIPKSPRRCPGASCEDHTIILQYAI